MNEELKLLIEDAIDDSFSLPLKNDGTDDFELFAKEKKQFIGQLEKILVLRPTCGVEQRLFLDEIEKGCNYEEEERCIYVTTERSESVLWQDEFKSDFIKVSKGE